MSLTKRDTFTHPSHRDRKTLKCQNYPQIKVGTRPVNDLEDTLDLQYKKSRPFKRSYKTPNKAGKDKRQEKNL